MTSNNLYTSVGIPDIDAKIGYRSSFMMLGSCFASSIGERLIRLKFPVLVNPFGVLYNPASIASSINALANGKQISEDELFFQNGLWNSYSHHSSFSKADKDECVNTINQSLDSGSIVVKEASHIIVTLGTSWGYRLKSTGEVVANCHKTPAKEFERFFISPSETEQLLSEAIENVRKQNPRVKFIFTISPIRHIKDGLVENQRSKSALVVAAHSLCSNVAGTAYFPSYEIMMDELRDYRFYASDMVHPSDLAVSIIFDRFVEKAINAESQQAMKDVEKVLNGVEHIPFNPHTPQHEAFRQKMSALAQKIQAKYSFLDLSEEISYFLK